MNLNKPKPVVALTLGDEWQWQQGQKIAKPVWNDYIAKNGDAMIKAIATLLQQ